MPSLYAQRTDRYQAALHHHMMKNDRRVADGVKDQADLARGGHGLYLQQIAVINLHPDGPAAIY